MTLILELLFSTKESTNSGSKYFKPSPPPPSSQKQMFAPSCSEIWAMPLIVKDGIDIATKYDSFHPNRIQIKFAKYILGVHKSATNIAVLGELGLYPLSIHSLKSCINYWLYHVNTQDNSLVFHSYKENILLKDGLSNKVNKFLTDIGFRHVWDNQGTLSRVALLKSIQINWKRDVNISGIIYYLKIMIIFGGEIS